jgi:osmoprotectant transport system permease protein
VVKALLRLEGKISTTDMQDMNSQAQIDKERESVVAQEFLARGFGIKSNVEADNLLGRLAFRTWQHFSLVAVSLVLGILTAVPLGILAARNPILGQVILGVVGVVQTFPALALLSVLIILFHETGPVPAIAALYAYSLLPMVRNTYTGLRDIPLNVRESGEALGLSSWSRLWLIELPMASRSILAGIKTAAVINIGFATLGGLIGAGGYGDAIVAGLQRDDQAMLMEGALPAMAMALAAQGLFEIAERFLVPLGLRLKPAE